MSDTTLETVEVRAWMKAHGPELRAHVRRMMGSADAAEDVLQEVWITAHRSPPPEEPDRNVRAWLYRVATHAALDLLSCRSRRRTALEARGDRLEPEAPPAPDAFLDGVGPDGRDRVREELARLPRKQREAVWLRWGLGWDYARVAGQLDCSRESARANVYHGLNRLRDELADLWEEVKP